MKINNKSVTGVFSYTDTVIFEENDFVIEDGVIYFCLEETLPGERPSESDKFTVYLGNKATNIDEYKTFLDSPEGGQDKYITLFTKKNEGEDPEKYISVLTLHQIFNHYMLGPDGKGIIGSWIEYDENGSISVSEDLGTRYSNLNSILADIMMSSDEEEINHAMLRVSRKLPELASLGLLELPSVNSVTAETDHDYCILRQYTYFKPDKHKIRVQELIDPFEGMIYYRSADVDVTNETSSPTPWKCATTGNFKALKKRADNVFALYSARIKELREIEDHLKSNFRYRRLEVTGENKKVTFSGIGKKSPEVTILITTSDGGVYRKNYETTISLLDTNPNGTYPEYGIGENHILKFSVSGDDVTFTVEKRTVEGSDNFWISGAYYREYYEV